jgi:ribosomal protein S27AE
VTCPICSTVLVWHKARMICRQCGYEITCCEG